MTAPRFFHFANILVLFAWAGVLLYFYGSGRVNAVLTESFRIAPLVGGLGLAVVGLFNLLTPSAGACCGHAHHHPHEHEHEHEHEHGHAHASAREEDSRFGRRGLEDPRAEDEEAAHPNAHSHAHESHAHAHDHSDHGPEHEHSHDDQTVAGILATLFIVLVPAIGGAALSQDKFSVETLANKGLYSNEVTSPAGRNKARSAAASEGDQGASPGADEDRYTLADLEKQVRKSEEGNFLIPIPSLFYSAADEELADVLKGQPIETTGQVAPEIAENDPEGTRLRLYRLFISCCLADARPIGFSVDFGKAPPQFPEDTWVKIVGSMSYPEQDGRRVPVLDVDRIETIPEPENQMY